MKNWNVALLIVSLVMLGAPMVRAGESSQKKEHEAKLTKTTADTIELFKKTDPKLAKFFSDSAGYAVFPCVTKGAIGIGAAYGEGQVFAKGKQIGTASMTQVTIGAQLGGQEYSEVIFFETKSTLDSFAGSRWAMSAQATAVAAADGAAATAKYQQGVLVFTMVKGGLMFEASIGGQKFKFTPLKEVPKY